MNGSSSQMNEQDYLSDRVDDQLTYYKGAASKSKKTFNRMQILIIVLGVLVPVVVNVPKNWIPALPMINPEIALQLSVTIMSLIVAILTGVLNFKKYGDLWLSFRMTEELLKHEKFTFLTRSGTYSGDDAFNVFVQKIESLISHEHNKFHSLIQDSKRPTESENKNAG